MPRLQATRLKAPGSSHPHQIGEMAISLAPFNNLANRFPQFHIKKKFFLPKFYVEKLQKRLKDYKLPTLFWIHHCSHFVAFVFLMY